MAITIPLISTFDNRGVKGAIKEFKNLEGASAKAQFALGKASKVAGAALLGLGAAAIKMGKAAAEDQTSQLKLAEALKKSGLASDAAIKSTEDYISSLSMATAVADDDLRPAMANLVRATGDVTSAQEGLALAVDISAQTGLSLDSVSKALSKAYAGNTGALKKLNPALGNLVDKGDSMAQINEVLTDQFGGSAKKAADTAEGSFKKMSIAIGEAQESIGAALLPAVQAAVPFLSNLAKWAQDNPDKFKKIALVIGGLAVAVIAVNTAVKAWKATTAAFTAVQAVFNAVLAANPVVLIIGALIALGAALVLAYNKFEWFRDFVNTVWAGISNGLKFAVDLVKGYFDALVGFWKGFLNVFIGLWNDTVGGIGFTAPGWLKYIGLGAIAGKEFRIPEIPELANGGIVTAPTLALIGERGPEAVVPLNKAGQFGNVTIHVNGGDPEAVVAALRRYMNSNGAIPIRTLGVA